MFEFGFYEKEITPPLGCPIPGYFNLRRGSDVQDRLYARAAVVREDGNTVALISVDACTVETSVVNAICDRVEEYTGIARSNILVGYTHTHTGMSRWDYNGGDEVAAKSNEGFHTVVTKLIADCAILAYLRLQKAVPVFGKGEVTGISFCRDYFMKNSTPQTNPTRTSPEIEGPVADTDNELPVLFVEDESGKPLGAILGFACHPDCVSGDKYSGDYISELSLQLKKTYGDDFVSVYLLGACGDINHFDVSRESDPADHYRKMGRKLAGEAEKVVAFAEPLKQSGVKVAFETITIPRVHISDEKIAEAQHYIDTVEEIKGIKLAADGTNPDQYNLAMSKKLMNFLATVPESFEVPVQVIQIGEFTLYAFPSEIFCHFGKLVKQGDGTESCMVSTLCNASFGYVPTRDMFYDTIYESRPGSNQLDKEAGYIMAEKLVSMKK